MEVSGLQDDEEVEGLNFYANATLRNGESYHPDRDKTVNNLVIYTDGILNFIGIFMLRNGK